MGSGNIQPWSAAVWNLAARQNGVVSRRQLLGCGLSAGAIEHRVGRGRLHPLWRGVYAIGRPEVTQEGRWMGAVLACGPEALLSHRSAAKLWGLLDGPGLLIDVVVPAHVARRRPGIRVHRRSGLTPRDRAIRRDIPVTSLVDTLIDLAASDAGHLESAVNTADRLDMIDPEALRAAIESRPRRPGIATLKAMLDRYTLAPTDSVLERLFLAIVAAAKLPPPLTQVDLNGFRVDFYWPQFSLVVETDGLRYHRTPGQQDKDLRRDHAHAVAGLRTLRFSAAQVTHEAGVVRRILVATIGVARS